MNSTAVFAECHQAGGKWIDGSPCRMDARPGERCRFHRPGLAGAFSCAISAGVFDPLTSHFNGGSPRPTLAEREGIERLTAIGRLTRNPYQWPPPAVDAFETVIRQYAVTLHVLWDISSRPATTNTEPLAELLRRRLVGLRDDLGPLLPGVIAESMHKPYCEQAGNMCPYPSQRHDDECDQPYEPETGENTCDCPTLYDWEVKERLR
jgi:hypothetical protein